MPKKKGRPKKYYKGRNSKGRDYNSDEYKKWRKLVKQRDGYRCQFPQCHAKSNLQVHHILKWAEYPHLRFSVQNGITLCEKHHTIVNGNEDAYASFFLDMLRRKLQRENED